MIRLKSILFEGIETYRPALKLPDGVIVIARSDERTHLQIYMRLLKSNHPNVLSQHDPDIERGWADNNNNFLTDDEMSKKIGYKADTFAKPKYTR